jgi:hypothetical protein
MIEIVETTIVPTVGTAETAIMIEIVVETMTEIIATEQTAMIVEIMTGIAIAH